MDVSDSCYSPHLHYEFLSDHTGAPHVVQDRIQCKYAVGEAAHLQLYQNVLRQALYAVCHKYIPLSYHSGPDYADPRYTARSVAEQSGFKIQRSVPYMCVPTVCDCSGFILAHF